MSHPLVRLVQHFVTGAAVFLAVAILVLDTGCTAWPLDRTEYQGAGEYSVSGYARYANATVQLSCATARDGATGDATAWQNFATTQAGATGYAWAGQTWYPWDATVTLPSVCSRPGNEAGSIAYIKGTAAGEALSMFAIHPFECSIFRTGYGINYGPGANSEVSIYDLEECYAQDQYTLHIESPNFDDGCGHLGQSCCTSATYQCGYGLHCDSGSLCAPTLEGDWSSMTASHLTNHCARGVLDIFSTGFGLGDMTSYNWTHGKRDYPPQDVNSKSVLNASILDKVHYQGFVHTGISETPYAFIHNRVGGGGVLGFVDDDLKLIALHPLIREHPNALTSFDGYVALTDGTQLVVFNAATPLDGEVNRFTLSAEASPHFSGDVTS